VKRRGFSGVKGRSFSCAVTASLLIVCHHEEGFSPTRDLLFQVFRNL
jgi:hypothetical protein